MAIDDIKETGTKHEPDKDDRGEKSDKDFHVDLSKLGDEDAPSSPHADHASKSIVVETKDLNKNYIIDDKPVPILRNINVQIHAGEFIIIFGPSGCGKSTLLNILSGLETVSSGKVLVRGEDISKLKGKELAKYRRTKIGIVFQQYNLLRTLTSAENIALPLTNAGLPYKRRINRAKHLLDMLGLAKLANKVPVNLSGGEQQRISLGRALAFNPWIIFADEPTGNLDSKSADEVFEIFADLSRKSKRTVIMVTHNPNYLPVADRVLVMTDGQIVKIITNSPEEQAKVKMSGLSGLAPDALLNDKGKTEILKQVADKPEDNKHKPEKDHTEKGETADQEKEKVHAEPAQVGK